MKQLRTISILLFFIFFSRVVNAQLYQYNTPDQRLINLNKGYSYLVPHMASSFVNAMRFHKKFLDYKPYEDVTMLLNDFSDVGNGGTNVIPRNFLSTTVTIAPLFPLPTMVSISQSP